MGYRKQDILHSVESKGVWEACEEKPQHTSTASPDRESMAQVARSSSCPLPLYTYLSSD